MFYILCSMKQTYRVMALVTDDVVVEHDGVNLLTALYDIIVTFVCANTF